MHPPICCLAQRADLDHCNAVLASLIKCWVVPKKEKKYYHERDVRCFDESVYNTAGNPGAWNHYTCIARHFIFFFAVRLCSPALSICRRDDINNILDMKGSCIKFNPARAAEKRSAVKFQDLARNRKLRISMRMPCVATLHGVVITVQHYSNLNLHHC